MSGTKKEKNISIELFRILFTAVICIHHARGPLAAGWLKHGYLCVEFFFFVSGFFLYKSFCAESQHDSFRFLAHRICRLYPDYVLADIIAIFAFGIYAHKFTISSAAGELMMLQASGLIGSSYNYPAWYVSALVVGSFLVYGLLSVRREAFTAVIGPGLILLVYTYLMHQPGGLEQWQCAGPFSLPLMRGFAGLAVGSLIAALNRDRHMLSDFASLALEIAALALIALGLLTDRSSEMLTLFGFAFLLISVTYGENPVSRGLSNCKVIPMLSRYCYPVYLNHAFVIKALNYSCKRAGLARLPILLYFVLLICYSLATHFLVVKATALFQKLRAGRRSVQKKQIDLP